MRELAACRRVFYIYIEFDIELADSDISISIHNCDQRHARCLTRLDWSGGDG